MTATKIVTTGGRWPCRVEFRDEQDRQVVACLQDAPPVGSRRGDQRVMYMLTRYPHSRIDRRDEVTLRDVIMPRSAESHPVTLAEVCLRALRDHVPAPPEEERSSLTPSDRYWRQGSLRGIRGCGL